MNNKMKIDEITKIEKKILEDRKNEKKTIWRLMNTLHSVPVIRNWLTLESLPLFPLLEKKGNEYVLNLLFSTKKNKSKINYPWGFAAISWPKMKLKEVKDLSEFDWTKIPQLSTKHICNKDFADSLQKTCDNNSKIQLPPDELLTIYKKMIFFDLTELEVKNAKKESKDNSNVSKEEIKIKNVKAEIKKPKIDWLKIIKATEETSKLLRKTEKKEFSTELIKIKKKITNPIFSIAVVGEFNRGKSTFINNLLGEDLLPTGELPTTALLTKIKYGPTKRIYWFYDGKKQEIDDMQWEKLIADNDGNDPKGVLSIEIPNGFMKQSGIQLIDTPGAGDIFGKRAAITTGAIVACDATIVAVSALAPFSLTEKSFVEDSIFLKNIPRIALLATRFDQLEEKDRSKVFNHLQKTIEKWDYDIPMWISGYKLDPFNENVVFGKKEISDKILEWSSSSNNDFLRYEQVTKNLVYLLEKFVKLKEEEVRIDKLSYQEKRVEIEAINDKIKDDDLKWKSIILKLEERLLAFNESFKNILDDGKEEILEDLTFQLKKTPNPKIWWTDDLPHYINRFLKKEAKSISAKLQNKATSDINWFYKEMDNTFDWRLTNKFSNNVSVDINNKNIVPDNDMINLGKARTIARLGLTGATMIGYVFNPMVGMGIGAVGAAISETIFKKEIDAQRNCLKIELNLFIEKLFSNITKNSYEKMKEVYLFNIDKLKEEQKIWYREVLKKLKESESNLENNDILETTNQLDNAKKILKSL